MRNRQAIINVIGNFIYLFGQFWMTIIVARFDSSFYDAGILALAMTVTNMFYIISSYGMRTYQVSDINDKFSYREYTASRYITIAVAFGLCIIYCLALRYSGKYMISTMLYMIYKSSEAYSDVCYGIFQRENNYNTICFSLSVKGILNIILFSLIYIFTRNINLSLAVVISICLMVNYFIDRSKVKEYSKSRMGCLERTKITSLLRETFPLMLALIFPQIILAIPRLYFEKRFSTELFGIYSSISSPTIVITTFVSCAIMPFVPLMAEYYDNNKVKEQISLMLKCMLACIVAGLFMFIGSLACGRFVLKNLYGNKVLPYMDVFYLIILVTTLSAMIMCMNAVFIAIRKLGLLVIILALGTLACVGFTQMIINEFAMKGLTYVLILGQGIELVLLWVMFCRCLMKKAKVK